MTKISLISTRCPPSRHTQKGQAARVSNLPGLGRLLLRSEGGKNPRDRDSQGMCMLRHGPGPAALASRVCLACFQHSAPGALRKKKSLWRGRQGTTEIAAAQFLPIEKVLG